MTWVMITEEGFRQWLIEMGDKEVAPAGYTARSCPIASYLRMLTGTPVEVGRYKWTIGKGQNLYRYQLPLWAMKYIRMFDQAMEGWDDPISGTWALESLSPPTNPLT